MQITRNSIETMAGPSEWFTGAVYVDTVARRRAFAPEREQRPLHTWRPHGMAHAPQRPDHLRHRGRRPRAASRRAGRGHPPR